MRATQPWLPYATLALGLVACGPDPANIANPNSVGAPAGTVSIGLEPTGVDAVSVVVLPGGKVAFVNHDTRVHDLASSGDCAELEVGALEPGAQRTITMANVERTCAYGDRGEPDNVAFKGIVVVTRHNPSGVGAVAPNWRY